ncbi:NAD(P)/FAD-dependent oxidoreductase [Corallincola holothuriorum]|uniref:NAD(P)/FAD-dependent oxidoreductase n=1 Tax=Corallincola holothuriorum TaxID=2282215 RepID=A0A368NN89_9GAMM|nr:NAD(P)/FAD-dependent oxidoreductase [Corallincola holothuriorum]RCU50929.1 NAD(P)/FAD-dependent oxidoreductase [Corallincola holothuriorum]
MTENVDVVVIGAGAAGLMCAAEAGKRGRSVRLLDHGKKAGRKIIISGGGRCNFTNMYAEPANYLSQNPHFCKSALAQYTQWDFIAMVDKHGIAYHEKTLGQLFCDDSAHQIVDMLLKECDDAGVKVQLRTEILGVEKLDNGFLVKTSQGELACTSLVVACGGLSMPKLGATPLGYQIAEQFGLNVLPTRAGLVPFTLQPEQKEVLAELSGVSVDSYATAKDGTGFKEALLFTHRGLSGPAVLQVSSYWQPGEAVTFDLSPQESLIDWLLEQAKTQPQLTLKNALARKFPKSMVEAWIKLHQLPNPAIGQLSNKLREQLNTVLHQWQVIPSGTEGYRTAEVTLGGVDTNGLSSKTMAAKNVDGLYFIGEVVDVTGWLGGFNFQWAWSSGWLAGQYA